MGVKKCRLLAALLAVLIFTAGAAEYAPRQIAIYFNTPAAWIRLTDHEGEIVRPVIINDRAYAPLDVMVTAFRAEIQWNPGSVRKIANIWQHPPDQIRQEANTIFIQQAIPIGFQSWGFDLPETIKSGVTWEFVSIDNFVPFWEIDEFKTEDFVWLQGYDYTRNDDYYAARTFTIAFSRGTFESFLP